MRIEFVNHSSFLADCGEIRLLCDPWLEGTAFDDGWALLSRSVFQPEDWERVTHLWLSHEHPDHFSPAALRAVPEPLRARISGLYQATSDHKVAEFCRRLDFREVRELEPGGWVDLGAGVSALCEPWTSGDSWLALRTPRATLVNLNDCAITTPAEIASIAAKVGRVDLLATQFSISSWDGNSEEVERLQLGAKRMLERLVVHARGLDARWTLPFASFVWFCHEENAYLNRFHNRVEIAATALRERTHSAPVVLYPGDRWELDAAHDPASA
ncbi:MAG: MBL fold metallo-hydrolase, partial [Myxococcales bacterium]